MAHNLVLHRAVHAGQPVRWTDVAYDAADTAIRFRRGMEEAFRTPPGAELREAS